MGEQLLEPCTNLGRSDSKDRSCARPGEGAEGEIR